MWDVTRTVTPPEGNYCYGLQPIEVKFQKTPDVVFIFISGKGHQGGVDTQKSVWSDLIDQVSWSCRTEMLPPITVRTSVPTTPGYPHLRQCSDRRPSHGSHPHQFTISCPLYLCVYVPIYIRNIVFTWHFYIPEHYRCSLMRTLKDLVQKLNNNSFQNFQNFKWGVTTNALEIHAIIRVNVFSCEKELSYSRNPRYHVC